MAQSLQGIQRRAGSEDPIDFTLREDTNGDGVADAPINLTGVQSVTLHLRRADGTIVSFATTDVSPLLTIISAVNGQLRLSPAEDTWQNDDVRYRGYFVIVDATGKDIPVPEGSEFWIAIQPAFE